MSGLGSVGRVKERFGSPGEARSGALCSGWVRRDMTWLGSPGTSCPGGLSLVADGYGGAVTARFGGIRRGMMRLGKVWQSRRGEIRQRMMR